MNTFLSKPDAVNFAWKEGQNPFSKKNFKFLRILRFYLALCLLITATASLAQDVLIGLTSAGGPNGGGTAFSIKTTGSSFTVVRKFIKAGNSPEGDLVKGTDGNFYGMAYTGGTMSYGTIFKISSSGVITVIKNLDYYNTGGYPYGSLVIGNDGNFYGMTYYGGTNYRGTIFKITSTGTLTVIKHLSSTTGSYPYGSLVKGTDGNFYGMTNRGGTYDYGTIFKITPTGALTVLKNLSNSIGGYPYGSLVQGNDGNFYGMTYAGGTNNYGTIFKITPTGTHTILKHLNYTTTSGSNPYGSLIKGSDGNFYGMTYYGGSNYYGTIFKITPTGTFKIFGNLNYSNTGGNPRGSLIQGADGNFYGMATYGGTYGYGTIFKITPAGAITVLRHLKNTTDGSNPYGSLFRNSTDGYLYGMTSSGGTNYYNGGTIFKISTTGSFNVSFRFPDNAQGFSPQENLIQAKDGYFYGTAYEGGNYGVGSIYKLCTSGSYTVLRSLVSATNGGYPKGSLVQGTDGYFYGMTYQGGTYGHGTIFKMSSTGTITVIKHLNSSTTGGYPLGTLVQGNDGNFYGMNSSGGSTGYGTIFKVTSTGTLTVLRNLNYATDGYYPYGSLTKGTDGNFYGMTYAGGANSGGTIFKITPTGTFTVIKSLTYSTGYYPYGSLKQGKDGNFYGMATYGGAAGYGTVFKITPTGTLTVLENLDGTTTGGHPQGDLVQASDGAFYGMTVDGGTYKAGIIFKITTSGTFTTLRSLKPATDGGTPYGSLIVQKPNPVANAQSATITKNTTKKIKLTGSGGLPLTYSISTQPIHGTASIYKDTLTYTPAANYVGKDSLYFYVTWGCQNSALAKVKINVTATTTITETEERTITIVDRKENINEGKLFITASPNPSPASFNVSLKSNNSGPVTVRVFDATGRLVEVRNNTAVNSTIRVGDSYQPGFYFVEGIRGSERVILKLLKSTH